LVPKKDAQGAPGEKKPNKMPTIPCGHAKAVMRFLPAIPATVPSSEFAPDD